MPRRWGTTGSRKDGRSNPKWPSGADGTELLTLLLAFCCCCKIQCGPSLLQTFLLSLCHGRTEADHRLGSGKCPYLLSLWNRRDPSRLWNRNKKDTLFTHTFILWMRCGFVAKVFFLYINIYIMLAQKKDKPFWLTVLRHRGALEIPSRPRESYL